MSTVQTGAKLEGRRAEGEVRWGRGWWREGVAAAPGASGVQRQEEEVTVCRAPGPWGLDQDLP